MPTPKPWAAAVRDDRLVAAPYRRLSDEALVVLVGQSETLALAELHARYRAPVNRLARRILRDAELAEDAVQEAFLHMWRSAARFSAERGPARMWILTMVHRRAVDIVRSRGGAGTHEPLEVVPEPSDPAAEDEFDAIGEREVVRRALRSLPPRFRTPLALAYYADLTQRECADVMSEPLGTVKSRTCRGLTRLREQLAALEPPAVVSANNR
jgi:RNA polymerase sigma-70 factor (ECF subfamily)